QCRARFLARRRLPKHDNRRHSAERCLALLGDDSFLQETLVDADRFASDPALKVSGGSIDLWRMAPLQTKLRLARERLDSSPPTAPLRVSIETVRALGDTTDCERVSRLL